MNARPDGITLIMNTRPDEIGVRILGLEQGRGFRD